eukprot:Hpha_TRINITY_DN29818_c0_g1::TRINITY_DN29818_c0_g1_i1::g.2906::m.2906/K00602/purH; phosphoribosylaminoimidazolecarboxamide formyltransferase / IMP cyclohydrolase
MAAPAKRLRTEDQSTSRAALLTVFNKEGLGDIAEALHTAGYLLVSTGGTKTAIDGLGLPVTELGELLSQAGQQPTAFGGRLKTLQPAVHGALLAKSEAEEKEIAAMGVPLIDVVVCNLAPADLASGADAAGSLDVGGHCLLRTAAKNAERVVVVPHPDDYATVKAALTSGGFDNALRKRLAVKALSVAARYDADLVDAVSVGVQGVQRIQELPEDVFVGRVPRVVAEGALAEARRHSSHRWAEADRPGRNTLNFGWDFVALEAGKLRWIPFPEPIAAMRDAMHALFADQLKGNLPGKGPIDLDNMIITFYGPGDSIVPHVDRDDRGTKPYYFSDAILGAVLHADTRGRIFWQRFERPDKSSLTMDQVNPDYELPEEAGASFLFRGTARHWPWYHGVVPVSLLRVSVTLRHTILVRPEDMEKVGEMPKGFGK